MHHNKKIHHFIPNGVFCDSSIVRNPDVNAPLNKKFFLRIDYGLTQTQRDDIELIFNQFKQECLDYNNTEDLAALTAELAKIES